MRFVQQYQSVSLLGLLCALSVPLAACGADDDGEFKAGGGSGGGVSSSGAGGASAGSAGTLGQNGGTVGFGGSSSPGGFSSGLPGNRTINSLSDQEWQELCREQFTYFFSTPAGQEIACLTSALIATSVEALIQKAFNTPVTDEQVRTTCRESLAECRACLKNPAACPKDEENEEGDTDSLMCDPLPDCQATVAELERCIAVLPKAYEASASSAPRCESLTAAQVLSQEPSNSGDSQTLPAECQIVKAKCPAFGD